MIFMKQISHISFRIRKNLTIKELSFIELYI